VAALAKLPVQQFGESDWCFISQVIKAENHKLPTGPHQDLLDKRSSSDRKPEDSKGPLIRAGPEPIFQRDDQKKPNENFTYNLGQDRRGSLLWASHIVGNPYRQVIAINEGNCEENSVVRIWEDSVDKCNGRTVVKVIISVPCRVHSQR